MERRIGRYAIGQTLGEGGFSKVKLGVDTDTNERVALKILRRNRLGSNTSVLKQVEAEVNSMSRITHPNVIRLREVNWEAPYPKRSGQTETVILVVLELATGGELFDFMAYTGCFDERIARAYFQQLISALHCCHGAGVCHRDLKPENLLIDGNFVLKLADFGFSAVIRPDSLMRTECGTRGYMSPELLGSAAGYEGTASDVWACGVILFIMLAGFPPLQVALPSDWWFQKLMTQQHALFWEAHCRNAFFSDQAKDLIIRMLTPDPAQRITVPQIMQHAWYTAGTVSPQELHQDLQRRKQIVDVQKERERMAQMRQRQARGGAGGAYQDAVFTLDGNVMRGDDDEQDDADLPPAPLFDDNNEMMRYTRFHTNLNPRRTLTRLTEALHSVGCQFKVNEAQYKVKASLATQNGNLAATFQVMRADAQGKQHIVDARRSKGTQIQFKEFFDRLSAHMTDIIAPSTDAATLDAMDASNATPVNSSA